MLSNTYSPNPNSIHLNKATMKKKRNASHTPTTTATTTATNFNSNRPQKRHTKYYDSVTLSIPQRFNSTERIHSQSVHDRHQNPDQSHRQNQRQPQRSHTQTQTQTQTHSGNTRRTVQIIGKNKETAVTYYTVVTESEPPTPQTHTQQPPFGSSMSMTTPNLNLNDTGTSTGRGRNVSNYSNYSTTNTTMTNTNTNTNGGGRHSSTSALNMAASYHFSD